MLAGEVLGRLAAIGLTRRPGSVGASWYTGAMLHELRIENLLLIDRAELRLTPGLNVVTGETGAGKTLLAQSLDLLLGGRAGQRRGARAAPPRPTSRACSRSRPS